MIAIQKYIIPKWRFDFTDTYIIATDNKVYNLKTRKLLTMQVKGYTKGYYLHGKFYSNKILREQLVRIEK